MISPANQYKVYCGVIVSYAILAVLLNVPSNVRSSVFTSSSSSSSSPSNATVLHIPRSDPRVAQGHPFIEKGNHPPSFDSMKEYPRKIDYSKTYDVCAVGAGLSGTVLAERAARLLGQTVLVLDARPHVGGNLYDYKDPATGVIMNLYGSHLFHTNIQRVWDYLMETSQDYRLEGDNRKASKKAPPSWDPWYHQKVGVVNNTYVPIPPNMITVNTLFRTNLKTEEDMQEWLQSVQIPCPSHDDDLHDGNEGTQSEKNDGRVGNCRNAEEMALSQVGRGLYEAIFETYTLKQWNKTPAVMDASVTARIPVRFNTDPRYFSDKFQALPSTGYTSWFTAIFDRHSDKIDVVLETNFFEHMEHLVKACGKIIYTGPIDRFFEVENTSNLIQLLQQQDAHKGIKQDERGRALAHHSSWPTEKLEYRSLNFVQERYYNHPGYVLPTPVVNYPGPETPYTRAVEYKQYLHRGGQHSVVIRETSSDRGEPYYPVPTERNRKLYEQYKALADQVEATGKVKFVGRLANYKYFNMDQAIDNALNIFYDTSSPHNDWTTFFVGENFYKYKATIDAKIQANRERRALRFVQPGQEKNICSPPHFKGEYGVELRVVVPWYHAISQDCLVRTTGVTGTKYTYFFSDNHSIDRVTQRTHQPLPEGNPFRSDRVYMPDFPYDTPWLAPPFREFFHRSDVSQYLQDKGKPLIFISNKYRGEWRKKKVSNFMSIWVLRKILSHLTPKYTVVYKRYTRPELRDWEDFEKDEFGDKKMIKEEFPGVVLFENLSNGIVDDPEDENLLMYSLMATSEGCIVVQGGMAVACSYFGRPTNILIKTGPELDTGGYSYFHRFSNTTISWTTKDRAFVRSIEEQF